MKLIQINGWLGRLNGPLERFLLEQNPDFICIQEAFDAQLRPPTFADQLGYISAIIAKGHFDHYFFAPAWALEMIGTKIDIGNIIISRFPLTHKVQFHTHNSYHFRKKLADTMQNTRVFQACEAILENGKILSLANHQGFLPKLGHEEEELNVTLNSMEKVVDGLKNLPHPIIFCGDLNSHPGTKPIQLLEDIGLTNLSTKHHLKATLSPAHRAPKQDSDRIVCDYIFVSDDVKVNDFHASDKVISDHKALVLEFDV